MESKNHQLDLFQKDRPDGKDNQKELKKFLLANYYDSKTTATILGIATKTLYRKRRQKEVPFIKVFGTCLYEKLEMLDIAKARAVAQQQKKGGLK
jgi:hypothetical protein